MGSARNIKVRGTKAIAFACLMYAALSMTAPIAAQAQFAQPLNTLTDPTAPGQVPPNPAPPPPGDGPNALPVIAGDQNAPNTLPTGQAQQGAETPFPTGVGTNRSIIRIFVDNGDGRGPRMVQTIRPDQLNATQAGQVQGILGVNTQGNGSTGYTDVTLTTQQMQQLQNILFPYPQVQTEGNGLQQITQDAPAPGYPRETALYQFQGPLPTVKTFCHYLVILGVVCATIFMAIASVGVVMGQQYAGSRVIGAAGGLMLLLCGYTIWKIVQMNTFNANSNNPAVINQRQQAPAMPWGKPNTPVVPQAPNNQVQRSPLPVAPLNGN